MASLPHSVERGPFTTSMRSIASGAMFCSAGTPIVPGLMRTPSTSTTVWSLLVPRVKSDSSWPGPPLRAISRPAWRRSSSPTSVTSERSMSSRAMTNTGTAIASSGSSVRVAVTTVSSIGVPAAAEDDRAGAGTSAATADVVAQTAASAVRTSGRIIVEASPCTPAWNE